jgi:hypothetical protein
MQTENEWVDAAVKDRARKELAELVAKYAGPIRQCPPGETIPPSGKRRPPSSLPADALARDMHGFELLPRKKAANPISRVGNPCCNRIMAWS